MLEQHNPSYVDIADRIGVTLCRDAIWDQHRCNWLGWSLEVSKKGNAFAYRSGAGDLYSGTSGIALFLAELQQFTQDRQQLRVLEGAINQAISVKDATPNHLKHGFYSGLCGLAYALSRIGALLEREDLITQALAIFETLHTVAPDDQAIDVIAGSAGAIPVLIKIACQFQRPELIDLARVHGRHLLRLAHVSEKGWSWSTLRNPVKANLTGHSHGVAGIVTAFLELYRATSEAAFLQAAMEGLRYERSWFCSSHANWPDLRDMARGPTQHADGGEQDMAYAMAWCHGAPGIGLSRLRNAELLPDNVEIAQDLDAAIQSTAASLSPAWEPGHSNYSLCHGAAGNAELMIMAGQRFQRSDLMAIAEKVGQEGQQFYVRQGLPWPCGNNGAGETPGLMLGTAGIGHFYLRLYDPVAVPSVLLISP